MITPAETQALLLSLQVGAFACLITLPLGLVLAWLLARKRFWGRALLNTLVHSPLVLPPVAVGYLLLLTFGVHSPIGRWLDHMGWRLPFTTAGAVVSAAAMGLPLMVRSIKLSFDSMERKYEWAAATLGAKPWDTFVSITLPLVLPGIVAGLLMTYAASLGEFGATITFAANIEGVSRTLPLAIYNATQVPDGDAMALRLVLISLTLSLLLLWVADVLERATSRMLWGEPSD